MKNQRLPNLRQLCLCSSLPWEEMAPILLNQDLAIGPLKLVMAALGGGELPITGRIQESKQTPVRGSLENSICSVDIVSPALFWGTTVTYSPVPESSRLYILICDPCDIKEIHVSFHDIAIVNVMCHSSFFKLFFKRKFFPWLLTQSLPVFWFTKSKHIVWTQPW